MNLRNDLGELPAAKEGRQIRSVELRRRDLERRKSVPSGVEKVDETSRRREHPFSHSRSSQTPMSRHSLYPRLKARTW